LVVTAIRNNLSKFSVKSKTVAELQLGIKEVLTIREDQNAFEAFKLIHAKKVLGIAVVDANGVLTGNISASDLRVSIQFSQIIHND
jgi:CBS domain-containing protein